MYLVVVVFAFAERISLISCETSGALEGAGADHVARFKRLATWIQRGIDIAGLGALHPSLLDTLDLRKGRFGFGLFARRRFEEGETIAAIPLSRLVSSRNFGTAEASLPLSEGLALFLAKQKRLGIKARFSPYVDLIPEYFSLPAYWDPSFLAQHLQGSDFPIETLERKQNREQRSRQISIQHNVSVSDLMWGFDALATRSLGVEGLDMIMFPIFDMALHDDVHNIGLQYYIDRDVLEVKAVRRIHEGGEILNSYLSYGDEDDPNKSSNGETLSSWGFASERVSANPGARCAKFRVNGSAAEQLQLKSKIRKTLSSPLSNQVYNFEICDSVRNPKSQYFLGFLRQLAASPTSLPEDSNTEVPASTWNIEKRALRMGFLCLKARLQNYPQSLEEDQALLTDPAAFTDPRIRFMIMLRRDEKVALSWWLARFRGGIETSSGKSKLDMVDESYLLDKPSMLRQVTVSALAFLQTLAHDAKEAADQPFEFGLVVGAIATVVQILVSLMRCFCTAMRERRREKLDNISLWRPSWLAAFVAYGLNATQCRWDMVKFTLDHQMTLAWIAALALWIGVNLLLYLFMRRG